MSNKNEGAHRNVPVQPIDTSKIKPIFKAPYPKQREFVQKISVPPGVRPTLKGIIAAQIILKGDKWLEKLAKWLPLDSLKWILQGAAGGIKLARKYYGIEQSSLKVKS